ncbi:MAG: hypothetical protein J7545_10645 [Roseofilum sp. SBFL]|uniref:hypothetical protein n=1 Tax=unclassified Roseofilum TaxID=2620099 RepID=UPI001B163FC4|nr:MULTISPECIES: hypothetical protein [unclassified Roseofilum]MBP0014132.1 hypothetical protein [Roseofilum sp. SID3]MBP0024197.1 hypothetical protein [Roseofilum sp. SID2]MBP0042417.1 hypothetical protein [Roseofilum sp. SBFL]
MSSRDEYIQNFITLVETQWPLFVDRQEELEQLGTSLPPDTKGISNAIASWCKSRPPIRDAMDAMSARKEGDRTPGSQGNAPSPPDPKLYQEMLQNTIRRQQKPAKEKL